MKSIKIQNLKSIINSGDIELKNMTVLIGKNSSGKSTLLRTFPLLKQSIAKSLSSPILWYGDYVDFGSFKKALTRGAEKESITLTFVFDEISLRNRYFYSLKGMPTEIRVSLTLDDKNITEYLIEIPEHGKLSFVLNDKKEYQVSINGERVDGLKFQPSLESSFFPKRVYEKNDHFNPRMSMLIDEFAFEFDFRRGRRESVNPYDLIFNYNKNKIEKYADDFYAFGKDFWPDDQSKSPSKEKMASELIGSMIYGIISNVDKVFKGTFENVQYFEPLRASGDRFYRVQGLNVREVDSNGENAPMILYSMSSQEKKNFQKWCTQNLGFYYEVEDIGDGHESTSVVVNCGSNNDNYNMTDVGFGYSQIFPIILSIWVSFFSRIKNVSNKIIVIEQPELHLHPAFQKKIIATFLKLTKLAKDNKKDLKFIIETHSETIINYLGQLISDERIDRDDVNLLVCQKINNESVFEKMIFNKNGTIENWPLGFFSEDD